MLKLYVCNISYNLLLSITLVSFPPFVSCKYLYCLLIPYIERKFCAFQGTVYIPSMTIITRQDIFQSIELCYSVCNISLVVILA